MYRHIFLYNLKSILRSRSVVFWSLLFPVVLATLFHFAFGNLGQADLFRRVDIAVADSAGMAPGTPFYDALAAVSDIDGTAGEDDLFHARSVTGDEADSLLGSGDIEAYIVCDGEIRLVVEESGIGQTIVKGFIDDYLQGSATAGRILTANPDAAGEGLLADLSRREQYVRDVPVSSADPDTTVIYFYALLAMTCLMGSTVSVQEIVKIQADMSPLAARINTAPVAKFRLFLCNIAGALLFQLAVVMLVLAYILLVLGVNFGNRTGYVLLTCAAGAITGVFFGTAVSVGFRSTGIKYAITIGGTMALCFMAGINIADMKYIIQQYVPVLGYLNPANLIADAFYSLYYYDALGRYFINIALLWAFSAVLCAVTCIVMRRKTYASL